MMQAIGTSRAGEFSRRALQVCVLIGSLVPILAGLAGALRGP
jgi:hypothetical protein